MFYSVDPIPSGIHYFQIKVVQTIYGMISIGVMSDAKRQQTCIYCDSEEMYYFYGSNANIYNGKILNLIHKSKGTRFQKIKAGDVVTVFVDNKDKVVIWYINNRYAGSESISLVEEKVYPFIEMTSRGDSVEIVE